MNWHTFVTALSATDRELLKAALQVTEECLLNSEEMSFIVNNRPVDAMKNLRARLGMSLKEARDLVYAFRDGK